MRYLITYTLPVRSSWLGWDYPQHFESVATKKELNVWMEIIKEDASITNAFYEDRANGEITHFKSPS